MQPLESKFHIERFFLKHTHEKLFQSAVKGRWEEVREICRGHWVLNIQITESMDTVLHLAAYNNREDIFELLQDREHHLTMISLAMKNMEGNTPLHIAALMGNVTLCRLIIEISKSKILLQGVRNKEGETPLFKAVLHCQEEVFLYLHSILDNKEDHVYYERNYGETILHCAITEEYYGEHFHT